MADNYGIELFNVSDSASIIKIAEIRESINAAHDIDVDDNYIYVALGGGLLILEVGTIPDNSEPDYLPYVIISIVSVVVGIAILIFFKIIKKRKTKS